MLRPDKANKHLRLDMMNGVLIVNARRGELENIQLINLIVVELRYMAHLTQFN